MWDSAWDGNRTIILDNSVVEQKNPIVDPKAIIEAANIVNATVIVLPDIYKKGPETIESCKEAYEEWTPLMTDELDYKGWSYMMVPQGRTLEEYAACVEEFAPGTQDGPGYLRMINWWGIPRNMVEITGHTIMDTSDARIHHLPGSRDLALKIAAFHAPWRAIHMLGFSDNVIDDWRTVRWGGYAVRGIDSAVPLRAASVDMPMSLDLTNLGPRPKGWLENAEYTEMMHQNIQYTKWLFGGN